VLHKPNTSLQRLKGLKGYSQSNFAQRTGNHPDASSTRTLTWNKQNAQHI